MKFSIFVVLFLIIELTYGEFIVTRGKTQDSIKGFVCQGDRVFMKGDECFCKVTTPIFWDLDKICYSKEEIERKEGK